MELHHLRQPESPIAHFLYRLRLLSQCLSAAPIAWGSDHAARASFRVSGQVMPGAGQDEGIKAERFPGFNFLKVCLGEERAAPGVLLWRGRLTSVWEFRPAPEFRHIHKSGGRHGAGLRAASKSSIFRRRGN